MKTNISFTHPLGHLRGPGLLHPKDEDFNFPPPHLSKILFNDAKEQPGGARIPVFKKSHDDAPPRFENREIYRRPQDRKPRNVSLLWNKDARLKFAKKLALPHICKKKPGKNHPKGMREPTFDILRSILSTFLIYFPPLLYPQDNFVIYRLVFSIVS